MNCRSCGSTASESVLDLGRLPISDFPKVATDIDRAPLEVMLCPECGLVQLKDVVSRDRIYRGDYWYKSGTNESMVRALGNVVSDVMAHVELNKGDAVLDIGCNDGTLLSFYPSRTAKYGVEPSELLALKAITDTQARVFISYFPWQCIPWHFPGTFKIITSIAQFYNVENVNAYVSKVKEILHPEGVWCLQMADLRATLRGNNLGDFCHEHLTFWTVHALNNLLGRHNLRIFSVSFNDVNGGSFRVMVRHGQSNAWDGDGLGADDLVSFAERINQIKGATVDLIDGLKGKTIIGLGASTKNNTVLSYYDIGPERIPYFADRQVEKHGRFTVTGIPIISEKEARAMSPDYYFVGPFHFLESLKEREREFLERGGQFIVPFPSPHLVGGQHAGIQQKEFAATPRH